MTTPGGTGTRYVTYSYNPPVLSAPASIIGSEYPKSWYRAPTLRFSPSRCLKPSPNRPSAVRPLVSVYTTHIIPDDKSIPSSACLAYRGGAMLNFAFWGFYALRL